MRVRVSPLVLVVLFVIVKGDKKEMLRYTKCAVFALLIVAILVPMVASASGIMQPEQGYTNCRPIANGMNCENQYGVRELVCNRAFGKWWR